MEPLADDDPRYAGVYQLRYRLGAGGPDDAFARFGTLASCPIWRLRQRRSHGEVAPGSLAVRPDREA